MTVDPVNELDLPWPVLDRDGANIQERLALASALIGAIGKDSEMKDGTGKVTYRFRSIDAIVSEAQPLFAKLGITMESRTLERSVSIVERGGDRKTYWSHVALHVVWSFRAPDGSTHIEDLWAEGLDNQDKGSAKAYTQSRKGALVAALNLAEKDAEDVTSAPDAEVGARGAASTRSRQEPPQAGSGADEGEALVTPELWAEIRAIRNAIDEEGRTALRGMATQLRFDLTQPTTNPIGLGRRLKALATPLLRTNPLAPDANADPPHPTTEEPQAQDPDPEPAPVVDLGPVVQLQCWKCRNVADGREREPCPRPSCDGFLTEEEPF